MALTDTINLERSLLKILSTSFKDARTYWNKMDENWFTSKERLFICSVCHQHFVDEKSLISKMIFERDVENYVVEAKERIFYLNEWNLIQNLSVGETVETLIAALRKAQLTENLTQVTEGILESLKKGDPEEAILAARRQLMKLNPSHQSRTVNYCDYQERRQQLLDRRANPEKYLGLRTGFKSFDREVGGLFAGELTLYAAVTGVGKSTMMKAITDGILKKNNGKNILYITNEETEEQVLRKFDALFTLLHQKSFKRPDTLTDEQLAELLLKWDTTTVELSQPPHGNLFVREVPAFTTIAEIEEAYWEKINQGIKIDLIIYDYLGRLKTIEQTFSDVGLENQRGAEIQNLARQLMVPILTATQGATVLEEKTEKGKSAGALDVYGGKGQVHNANSLVIVMRRNQDAKQADREESERDWFWELAVKKNRDGPTFSFYARHHVRTGKVTETDKSEVFGDTAAKSQNAVSNTSGGEIIQKVDSEIKQLVSEGKAQDSLVKPADIARMPVIARMPEIERIPLTEKISGGG